MTDESARRSRFNEGVDLPEVDALLGPVDYVSHTGERPIQFVWKLRRPMPADFFRQAKVATA